MTYSRRQFLGLGLLSILVAGGIYATGFGKDVLLSGTILVSRNADPRENTSPGYWNHVALVVNAAEVVEAQEHCGVIRTPIVTYLQRPYSRIIAIEPANVQQGINAARQAERLIGLPFRPLSSVVWYEGPLRQSLGINCVSLVKIAWRASCPAMSTTHTPDGIVMLANEPQFYGIRVLR